MASLYAGGKGWREGCVITRSFSSLATVVLQRGCCGTLSEGSSSAALESRLVRPLLAATMTHDNNLQIDPCTNSSLSARLLSLALVLSLSLYGALPRRGVFRGAFPMERTGFWSLMDLREAAKRHVDRRRFVDVGSRAGPGSDAQCRVVSTTECIIDEAPMIVIRRASAGYFSALFQGGLQLPRR